MQPIDLANDVIARARAVLAQRAQVPRGTPNRGTVQADLARLALVMGVVALDAYLHRRVLTSLAGQSIHTPLPKDLRKLAISLEDLAQLGREMVTARATARPMTRVRNVLHRVLLTRTFESSAQVVDALRLCGGTSPWQALGAAFAMSPDRVKERLDAIVLRRNQVVHEGDYRRLVRPQNLGRNQIRATDVAADIDWIEQLIAEIDVM